ncbi:MAG TPA: hypothetical protein V6D19_17245 [Stenomitos sp.]
MKPIFLTSQNFRTGVNVLLLLGVSLTSFAADANAVPFVLCGSSCGTASYFVGYNRTNSAQLNTTTSTLPTQPDRIYRQVADLRKREKLPNLDEQNVDFEKGAYVSSLHRIEANRVGFVRKSELMRINTSKLPANIKASVRLVWGDTLTVTSSTLPVGTPVNLAIQRLMGGFGAPATNYAHYNVQSQTLVNQVPLDALRYLLDKKPGATTYREVGQAQAKTVISVKVGDTLKLESLTLVQDGVVSSSTHQTLNGADSVEHRVEVLTTGANLRSASGVFPRKLLSTNELSRTPKNR